MSTDEGFDCPRCSEELNIPDFFNGECYFCGEDFDPFQTIEESRNEKKKL
jgi:hypothetical protein|tara:strand:+ start:38 stop:187 length:150 start_codon:yes stop_codon:yes gene_type:complete